MTNKKSALNKQLSLDCMALYPIIYNVPWPQLRKIQILQPQDCSEIYAIADKPGDTQRHVATPKSLAAGQVKYYKTYTISHIRVAKINHSINIRDSSELFS
jgi:hypothetical protein